jgi:hypothetical protein
MKMKTLFLAMLLITAALIAIVSCSKEISSTTTTTPPGKQSVFVYLNDDPVPNLLKVLVDIKYIEVKVDTGTIHHEDDFYNNDQDVDDDHQDHDQYGKWDTLSVTPRVYDLLKLKNGVDTLIANSYAHIGKITKVRITLGTDNTIWIDSTHSYPLTFCDNDSYLYVNVRSNTIDTIANGQVRIRIDFDVARSIEFKNGYYCLEPKLKCYTENNTGRIEGIVRPPEAHAIIIAYNNADTAYAVPEEDGEFKIRGLKPATYSLLYKTTAPFRDTVINNLQVLAAQKIDMAVVILHR